MNSRKEKQLAVKKLKTLVFTAKSKVDSFREKIEKTFGSVFLPNGVERTEENLGGILCDFLLPEIYSPKKILFYIHGGSFVGGSRFSYRSFCATLANASSCRVVVPEFRLAPNQPFPAAIEDVETAFAALCEKEAIDNEELLQINQTEKNSAISHKTKKIPPQIYIAADGSGASIALALMHSLNSDFRKFVRHLVFFSPWLDLTATSEKITQKKSHDEILSSEDLLKSGKAYTYEANFSNPQVSPLMIDPEKIRDFPPVFIQMGEREILLEDAQKYKFLLQKAGVPCTLDVWQGMINMFQLADEFLEESHLAIEKMGKIIKEN